MLRSPGLYAIKMTIEFDTMCKGTSDDREDTACVALEAPVPPNQSLNVTIAEGVEAAGDLCDQWDDLFRRAVHATPFLSHAWMSTFIERGRFAGTPLFVLVWHETKLVALLALAIHERLKAKIAMPISTEKGFYLGLLLDPEYESATDRMADVIASERVFDVYYSMDLSSEDRATIDLLDRLAARGYRVRRISRNPCFRSQLGCSFDQYFARTASAKSRQNLRRRERRLFEKRDVKVERYLGEEVTAEVLGRIAAVEERSWLNRRGAAVLSEPFYQALLLKTAQAGLGAAWLMTIDGEDAAYEYVLTAHKKLLFGWRAFDLKYESSLSIGQILMMHTIRDACSDGITSIDIGHGDAHYKRFWAKDVYSVERVAAGRGLRGRLIAAACYVAWSAGKIEWLKFQYRRARRSLRGSKPRTSARSG